MGQARARHAHRVEPGPVPDPLQRLGGEAGEQLLVLGRGPGKARQPLDDPAAGGLAEHRQDVVANPRPEQPRVVVARVVDRLESGGSHHGLGVCAANGEQGPEEPRPARPDGGRPAKRRATRQAHEKGLGLVVGGVGGGDCHIPLALGDPLERGVPGDPGPRLDSGTRCQAQRLGVKRQAPPPGELTHPRHLGRGGRPEPVIERGHGGALAGHLGRREQKRKGIHPAGHSHENSSLLAPEHGRDRPADDIRAGPVVMHATAIHTWEETSHRSAG